jgi:hypothetical protein
MRALCRRYLTALATAAAILSAAAPAAMSTAPAAHAGVALSQDCPPGTHWDSRLQRCV